MTKIDGLLTEDQAAEALGVAKTSMRNWSSRRQGPPRIRIGRKIFYRLEALNAWIASRERDFAAGRRKGR